MNKQRYFLTDEMERQLMTAEIERQFQPRPFKALAQIFKRAGKPVRQAFAPVAHTKVGSRAA